MGEVAIGVAENSGGAAGGVLVAADRSFTGKVALAACRYLSGKVEVVLCRYLAGRDALVASKLSTVGHVV